MSLDKVESAARAAINRAELNIQRQKARLRESQLELEQAKNALCAVSKQDPEPPLVDRIDERLKLSPHTVRELALSLRESKDGVKRCLLRHKDARGWVSSGGSVGRNGAATWKRVEGAGIQ